MLLEKARPEKNKAGEYCANLDLLRLLAVAAVVWIHSVETQTFKAAIVWCRFAVPAFTATSVWLLVSRHGGDAGKDFWTYLIKRAARIYLLFLAWNSVYAAARLFEHAIFQGGDAIRWNLETLLLAGFAEQLWFLPFLAAVTILAALPAFFLGRISGWQKWSFVLLLLIVGIGMAALPCPVSINLDTHPASYWFWLSWLAFPSALMVFVPLLIWKNQETNLTRPLPALMLILIAGLLLWLSMDNKYANLLQNIAGVALVWSAVLGPCAESLKQKFRALGKLALPIYLLHVLIVHALQAIGHRGAHLPVSMVFDGVIYVGGLFGSFLAAWVLLKIPCLQWIFTVR